MRYAGNVSLRLKASQCCCRSDSESIGKASSSHSLKASMALLLAIVFPIFKPLA